MTRTRLLKRIFFYGCAVAFLLVVGFYLFITSAAPGHFWASVTGARVTSNGSPIPEARIYRRPDGMLLMSLGGNNGWQLYRPDRRNVYWCNPIKNLSVPGYIYARDCDSQFCPCVAMGGAKTEVDAQLNIQPGFIEFNSRDHERIRVSW